MNTFNKEILIFFLSRKFSRIFPIFRNLLCPLFILTFCNVSYSQVSRSEWIDRCQKSEGQALKTYASLVEKFLDEKTKNPSHRQCVIVYRHLSDIREPDLFNILNTFRNPRAKLLSSDLSLEGFGISDLRPLSSFTGITKLYLDNNQISDLSPLSSLTNLETLSLRKNQISDIGLLTSFTNLGSLKLDENPISDLSPLKAIKKLWGISLNKNQISDLAPLASLTDLSYLYLNENQISDLGPLASLTRMTHLELNKNQISDLGPLASLTELRMLYSNKNQISDLSPLASLTKLWSLDLNKNQISDLGPLASFTSLKSLALSDNQISDLSPLSSLINIESLAIGKNRISDLGPLVSLTKLSDLELNENQISDLAPLASLTEIRRLYSNKNQISDLAPLASLTDLSYLYLNENQISDLAPLASLTKLRFLSLRDNQISDLSPLCSLPKLSQLNLRENPISDISPLSFLPNLMQLGLMVDTKADLGPLSTFKIIPHNLIEYIKESGLKESFLYLLGFGLGDDRVELTSTNISGDDINYRDWGITDYRDSEIEKFIEKLLAQEMSLDQDFLKFAATMVIYNTNSTKAFQLLVNAGLDLKIGNFSWGYFHDLAINERQPENEHQLKNIIENTHNGILWNKSSNKERFALAKKRAKNYDNLKRVDSELESILDTLEGEHVVFLNFEKDLFGHETEIFNGNKDSHKSQGPIVDNALRKILSNDNITSRFMGANTDKFHMVRGANFDNFSNYLEKYEDDLEVLILSGHGFEDREKSGKYCFGRQSEAIDFSIFTEKKLPKLKIIALSSCYPNQVASELSKYLPASVAILHTDSDEKTKCHDFENVIEYLMGNRPKNTELGPHNCAIKCIFGSNCTCTKPEGIKQLEHDGELFSGSSKYSPVKITWGVNCISIESYVDLCIRQCGNISFVAKNH